MCVNIKFVVTDVGLEYQTQITALVILSENLNILLVFLFLFNSSILLINKIQTLINELFHLLVQKS